MNSHTLYVTGTHCASCKLLIEDTLREQAFITHAEVDLGAQTLTVATTSVDTAAALAVRLTDLIKTHGYTVSALPPTDAANRSSSGVLWQALPIGLGLLALFFLLQTSGLLNIGLGGQVTPITSFIIGLIASVSSCLAIVGGLVLSLSAKISQDQVSDTKTFTLFHVGRLVGFAGLGGVLGAIGSAIGINFTLTTLLGIVASLVMLALGLHLVGVFKRNRLTMPPGIFRALQGLEHKTAAPLILGMATFFLPCGFTQSMQVAALSSGSVVAGSLIMFAFALGTFPMLALLSFGSATFAHGKHAPLFFMSAGIVVIGLGLFALLSGLAGLGVITPIFSI